MTTDNASSNGTFIEELARLTKDVFLLLIDVFKSVLTAANFDIVEEIRDDEESPGEDSPFI